MVRMGSDQFFSKNWLRILYDVAALDEFKSVYHTWTIESIVAKNSRHVIKDFGSAWNTLDIELFDQYVRFFTKQVPYLFNTQSNFVSAEHCGLAYNHPSRGFQMRPDGCTWLQLKALWEEYGPMRGDINQEGCSGDVDYMDRLTDGGVRSYLVPKSITYHLVRGESRDIQK